MAKIFIGQIINTKSISEFICYVDGFVAVDNSGKIVGVGDNYKGWLTNKIEFASKAEIIKLAEQQFLMPGFIDCHIHAPQVAQIGIGLDKPLLEWLHTYTFPLEAKFENVEYAKQVYKKVVENTIKAGTTYAAYFGTNHKDSTVILAKEADSQGQRALVGKVCSNCNSPDFYVESTEQSINDTRAFINELFQLDSKLIKAIITPRFALSCSNDLMNALGALARLHCLHIQSHISENLIEVDLVKKQFGVSYAQVYDNAKLLTEKTVMAHGVHLEDEEIALLKERGTSIAHCPASNTLLSSGLCDVRRLYNNGIKVGLGTDVSGGNSLSIKDAILHAMTVSHHLEFIKKQEIKGAGQIANNDFTTLAKNNANYIPLNYKEAIYLATLGGAEALASSDITGNFALGKEFDALIIDTSLYPLHDFHNYNLEDYHRRSDELKLLEMVQRFIYVGDDRNILKVYVSGRLIKG